MLWHLLARLGMNLRPTDKMLIGFVLTAATMAIMSVAGFLAGEAGPRFRALGSHLLCC